MGHSPSESTIGLRKVSFEQYGKIPLREGQERSPPAGCPAVEHGSGPTGVAASVLQTSLRILQTLHAACLDPPAAVC